MKRDITNDLTKLKEIIREILQTTSYNKLGSLGKMDKLLETQITEPDLRRQKI